MPPANSLNEISIRLGLPKLVPTASAFADSAFVDRALPALTDAIYREMVAVMNGYPLLRQQDYDLAAVKQQLIRPVARYLLGHLADESQAHPVKPLFVSGAPGIGKTTLLMVLDEALSRLNLHGSGTCRDMVGSGEIVGYFPTKTPLRVTPLQLFGLPTAALSARDWNNVLRHWTFDEDTARNSAAALNDFTGRLRGKVVIVDEAELEGYVYFSEVMAKHGVLVILSSNLGLNQIHLAPEHVRVVALTGLDHRVGDISKVCLPAFTQDWFDRFSDQDYVGDRWAKIRSVQDQIDGKTVLYLHWHDLANQPLMKDDFAQCFTDQAADFILLDAVPFFDEVDPLEVDLTYLGHLSRFVNFVDAIHDCCLPLLVRTTQPNELNTRTAGHHLHPVLIAYDQRTGGQLGHAAWIEWSRCLSRLRSREAINADRLHL